MLCVLGGLPYIYKEPPGNCRTRARGDLGVIARPALLQHSPKNYKLDVSVPSCADSLKRQALIARSALHYSRPLYLDVNGPWHITYAPTARTLFCVLSDLRSTMCNARSTSHAVRPSPATCARLMSCSACWCDTAGARLHCSAICGASGGAADFGQAVVSEFGEIIHCGRSFECAIACLGFHEH